MTALTHVELLHLDGQIERWIRFGRYVSERIVDRRARVLSFPPGATFAFVRWRAGDYGTAEWRIDILRAVAAGSPFSTVPFVVPGAESLLRISGWPKVQRVLEAIDGVERLDVDPADVAPEHWRHVHNQLGAGLEPRPYAPARHRAWLLRRRIEA